MPKTSRKAEAIPVRLATKAKAVSAPRKINGLCMVAAVGASAGGVEATISLLKGLPSDYSAAVIVLCHGDPHHKTALHEVLQRSTKLNVRLASRSMALETGHVFVVPPDKQAHVAEGILKIEGRARALGRLRSIDVLFESLAEEIGSRAVGVVLSGTGSDGSLGIRRIKSEGGITLAQDPTTAKFGEMPSNAMATGCVDLVLPPEEIGGEIRRIARHPAVTRDVPAVETPPRNESALTRIFALLRSLKGVDFAHYKYTTLNRRILRRMVIRKVVTLADYVRYLEGHPGELEDLFNDLLINVTSFFRDADVFDALKKKVIPKLAKQARGEPIRIWVPGCATGQEVYSLAITIVEALDKLQHNRQVQIFATDISEPALAKARVGLYPESVTAELSPERLRRFFQKVDGGYQISKSIRDSCVFARQNLVEDPPFSNLDLISCRNVLIYLGPALQKKVIPVFHYALKPSGYLLLGGSETIGAFSGLFELADKRHKFYVKRPATLQSRLSAPRVSQADPQRTPEISAPVRDEAIVATHDLSRQVDQLLLAQYGPSGVVINAKMDVLQFRGHTGDFIEHPPGEASLNLLKLVRPELLVDVRSAISRALKCDEVIRKENVRMRAHGRARVINIEVAPFTTRPSNERLFLMVFSDAPAEEAPSPKFGKGPMASDRARREITRLREELASSKESLQAIIEEQEATNEELKSANEEIQSSNEELQSTNEELETAKEELQSTNEELTTLNEELETRNGELHLLNNDLSNLLSSVSMPILMLGSDLTIRRFTPLAERVFGLIPADVGRRITNINGNVEIPKLNARVTEVIETLKSQEHEVQDRDGRWYSLRIRPYRTTDNKIDGAVILLVDIDEMRRGLDEFMGLVKIPLLSLRGDLTVGRANDAFYETFNCSVRETEGRLVYHIDGGLFDFAALRNLLEGVLPEKNRVDGVLVEQEFKRIGRKRLRVSARRLFQRGKGTQMTLMSLEELAG